MSKQFHYYQMKNKKTYLQNCLLLDEDEVLSKAQPNQEAEKKKKLINQFNYCERAVLTLNNPPRVRNLM